MTRDIRILFMSRQKSVFAFILRSHIIHIALKEKETSYEISVSGDGRLANRVVRSLDASARLLLFVVRQSTGQLPR